MSNLNKSNVSWNWSTAKFIPPAGETEEQIYYRERYGDLLTKHIKLAKKNARRIAAANKLQQSHCSSKVIVDNDDVLNATSSLSLAILEEENQNDYSLSD